MLALGVVDQCDGRLCHGGQTGDFARVVHAQLDHSCGVAGAQTQQGQGHADVVVEIAFGRKGLLALEGTQDGGDHLRHGGLAVAASDRNQGQRKLRPPTSSQLAQGCFGIRHLQTRQTSVSQAMLCQCSHSAVRHRLTQEVMRIKALALQRHKQITGAQAAGIGVHARKTHSRVAHQCRHRQVLLSLGQGHHDA